MPKALDRLDTHALVTGGTYKGSIVYIEAYNPEADMYLVNFSDNTTDWIDAGFLEECHDQD